MTQYKFARLFRPDRSFSICKSPNQPSLMTSYGRRSMRYFFITFVLLSTILSNFVSSTQMPAIPTPATHEFAWDIHDVIVKMSPFGMAKIAVKEGGLKVAHFIGLLFIDCIKYPFTRNQGRALTLTTSIYSKVMAPVGSTAEEFKPLVEAYDPQLWAVSRRMAAEYYPITGMAELLKELHDLGYTQRCASNMGQPEYSDLAEKHPSIFHHIIYGKLVDIHQENPARKPDIRYFEQYKKSINSSKTIIFIDDRKRNADAATKAGICGIQFKNAHQLRQELRALGIPVHP